VSGRYAVFFGAGWTQGLAGEWTSDTQVTGRLPRGAHSGLDISINISKQISWLSLAFSYDAPLASALSLHNSHTHTIAPGLARTTGFNFAQGDYSGAARWGETAAQHTRWISNTAMALRVVRGLARSLALAVSVGSGGLTCADTSSSALTSVNWAAMSQQEKDDYTLKYQHGCDRQILEMGSVMFQQLGTLSGAISYDSPVATAGRSFYGMSSNVANRQSQQLVVTSEVQPAWVERRLLHCNLPEGLLGVCGVTNCSANVTSNCSYLLEFASSRDDSIHATSFGLTNLTWQSHAQSPGQVLARQEFRFNHMWNTLTGSALGSCDMTPTSAVGSSSAEASVWTSDSVIASLAPVPVGGRSLAVAVSVAVRGGTRTQTASYDTPMVHLVKTAPSLTPVLCANASGPNTTFLASNSTTTFLACKSTTSQNESTVFSGELAEDVDVLQVRSNHTICTWVDAAALMASPIVHCNSLQHTATHCNSLQLTATHCNTLQQASPIVVPAGLSSFQVNSTSNGSINVSRFCANVCREGTNGSNASVSWYAANLDAPTSLLCADVCAVTEQTAQVKRETVKSCFQVTHYSANQPCTLSISRRALISGSAFAITDMSATSRISHTHSERTVWLSDSALLLRVASSRNVGGGASAQECAGMSEEASDSCRTGTLYYQQQQRLVLTLAVQVGSVSEIFTFDAPSLSSYHPANGPMTGSALVSLAGSHFGRAAYSPHARIGGCLAPVDPWLKWHGTDLTTYCEHGHTAPTAAIVTDWVRRWLDICSMKCVA